MTSEVVGPQEVKPDVLVVGAAEGSLGEAIAEELENGAYSFGKVTTAGISGEQFEINLLHRHLVERVLADVRPDVVVCTAGVNWPADIGSVRLRHGLLDSFENNVVGPMLLLQDFVTSPVRYDRAGLVKKFVAISSNSARIPRRGSMPYCASKAALSMALRVAARELAEAGGVAVWGYEPGLLAGTPMTRATEAHFGVGDPYDGGGYPAPKLHRMRGVPPEGLPVNELAERIVTDLALVGYAHNGVMIPYDAGEL